MIKQIFCKRNAYCMTCKILKKRLSFDIEYGIEYGENKTMGELIKDTMICLEDDDFENARLIIGKVDNQYFDDPNIEFLNRIISQSLSRIEGDYAQALCY